MPSKKYLFECDKCHRRYRSESGFSAHFCKEKQTQENLETLDIISKEAARVGEQSNKKMQDMIIKALLEEQQYQENVTKCFSCDWKDLSSEFSGLTDASVEHLANCNGPAVALSHLDKVIVLVTKSNREYKNRVLITNKYE